MEELEALRLQFINEVLRLRCYAALWCHVESKVWRPGVNVVRQTLLVPFVEAEEEKLRDCDCGTVFCDHLLFAFGVGVFADQGLYVGVGDIGEVGWIFGEGVEVVEEEEGRCWVFQRGGEEFMISSEEGDAI